MGLIYHISEYETKKLLGLWLGDVFYCKESKGIVFSLLFLVSIYLLAEADVMVIGWPGGRSTIIISSAYFHRK